MLSLHLGGVNATGVPAGGTLSYAYANLTTSSVTAGDVTTAALQTSLTNRNGNVTQYQFNQLGNVLNMIQLTRGVRSNAPAAYTNTFAYSKDGETTAHTNAALNYTQFFFDSTNTDRLHQGDLVKTVRWPGPLLSSVSDQASIVTSSTYEKDFDYVATSTDALGNVTTYTYDANGNCTSITNRIPSIVNSFTYNSYGQKTSHTLPDNGSGSRRLDAMTYYSSGPQNGYLQSSIVDSNGFALTTTYNYDPVGNVIRSVDPRGHDSTNVVNALNQVVQTISRAVTLGTNTVRYQTDTFYDANNNVTQVAVTNLDDNGLTVTNLPSINTTFAYDILDDLISRSQTASATNTVTITKAYDANQNLILAASAVAVNGAQPNNVVQTTNDERDLAFQQIRAPHDPGKSTIQYDYDGNQNVANVIQGIEDTLAPRITSYSYDGYDRRIAILDAMGNVTTTHYDPNGNAVTNHIKGELMDVPGSAANTNLFLAAYAYDPMNRRTNTAVAFFDTTTQANIGGGSAVTRTVYSANSQVITNFDANNNPTATIYDTANRPSVVIDAKGNRTTNIYDPNNNLAAVVEVDISDSGQPNQTFTTTFTHDNLDRLSGTTNSIGGTEIETYDSRNNRLSHTDENGNLRCFRYDGLNRSLSTLYYLTSPATNTVTLQQTWDDNSRLTSQTDDNGNTTSYLYDSLNRQTRTLYADGTTNTSTYDVHDNRVGFIDQSGTIVTSGYDLLNRLATNSVAPAAGVSGPVFEVYEYDGMSRVVRATNSSSQVGLAIRLALAPDAGNATGSPRRLDSHQHVFV